VVVSLCVREGGTFEEEVIVLAYFLFEVGVVVGIVIVL
jgi:hypothetical protein